MRLLERSTNSRHWRWSIWFAGVGAIAGCAALMRTSQSSSSESGYPTPEPLWETSTAQPLIADPALRLRGEELFHVRCAGCHAGALSKNDPPLLLKTRPLG